MRTPALTTDNDACNILARILYAHGVREAVVSPGSRNSPLITALASSGMKLTVVIDERSAAFVALGKSLSGHPAMLACTSGTAVLNYGPAVAEAYYRRIALIVVSADRPSEWIDQDDSQTLRQFEALGHFVKRSYDIPSDCRDDRRQWFVNRVVNEAAITAVSGQPGPVHINIQIDEPLDSCRQPRPTQWEQRVIESISPECTVSPDRLTALAEQLANTPRVMVIAGFGQPDSRIDIAVSSLARRSNVVVMTETVANITPEPETRFIEGIDRAISSVTAEQWETLAPDLLITFGGAIVSRLIKRKLREIKPEQWHIGLSPNVIDCMMSLRLDLHIPVADALTALVSALPADDGSSTYATDWHRADRHAIKIHDKYVSELPWCDLTAMRMVMESVPAETNLHLSNGTAVRYSQLFPCPAPGVNYQSNRGVSGIDGSTSTAVGDTRPDRLTLLVSGDMSFQYDLNALSLPDIPDSFKAVVLCNGGGNIFRFITSTRSHQLLEETLAVERPFPLRQLAEAYGFDYEEARCADEFADRFDSWVSSRHAPGIFALYTPGKLSARLLTTYFSPHPSVTYLLDKIRNKSDQ